MIALWLLLIYTVPAQPSRKRAQVWRALKRLGAVYLRDGVAVLPQRAETRAQFRSLVRDIEALEGEATLVESARLPADRAAALVEQARAARAAEYAEIVAEADRFLAHLGRESRHRDFPPVELDALVADLGKLRTWLDQVIGRDHFGVAEAERARAGLDRCGAALAGLRVARAAGR